MEEDPESSPPPEKKVSKARRATVKFVEPAKEDKEPQTQPQPEPQQQKEQQEEIAQEVESSSESEDEPDSEIVAQPPAQTAEAPAAPELRNSQLKTMSMSKRELKREKRSYTAMWNNFFNVRFM